MYILSPPRTAKLGNTSDLNLVVSREIIVELTWDSARVCPNGHVLTAHLVQEPDPGIDCPKCGEKGIDKCLICSTSIRGLPYGIFGSFKPRRYCHECWQLYPWANKQAITKIDKVQVRLARWANPAYWSFFIKSKAIEFGHCLLRLFTPPWTRFRKGIEL